MHAETYYKEFPAKEILYSRFFSLNSKGSKSLAYGSCENHDRDGSYELIGALTFLPLGKII